MTWRVSVLTIAVPLTVAVAVSLAAENLTVTLECADVPTTPQCPSGTSGGLLISPTDTRKARVTKRPLTFENVDNSFKEVMVFRRDRAPAFKQVTWTTAETLALKSGHEELPVRIWAVCTDEQGTCPTLTAARQKTLGEDMVAKLNSILAGERTGIKLVPPAGGTLISDESGTRALTEHRVVASCEDFKRTAVEANKFAKGALNIYIVHTVQIDEGEEPETDHACSNFEDLAAIGATGGRFLVLHEIGHMLALDHVVEKGSSWGSDPEKNFMEASSNTRKYFTEGQIFRMHLGWGSAIDVLLNSHPNDRRDCDSSSPALPCPKPNERVWADQ